VRFIDTHKMSRKRPISASEDKSNEVDPVASKPKTDVLKNRSAHIRDEIIPLSIPATIDASCKFIKVISWNVNGLNALVKSKLNFLTDLVSKHKPDLLCLQETKIQETMVDGLRNLLDDYGYSSYWNCSTVKKGYSGTAIFVNRQTIGNISTGGKSAPKITSFFGGKSNDSTSTSNMSKPVAGVSASAKAPEAESKANAFVIQKVSYDFEDEDKKFHGEGRTITIEFDRFVLLACYVPNSGDGLVRLAYRVNEWDAHMRSYLKKHNQRKAVVFTGDLNCGHLDLDIHNPDAKHIDKQAGLTPQERASFTTMLEETRYKDALRYLYPDARGQFTYWSQRTFARPVNRGIRLDYFICSPDMFAHASTSSSSNSSSSSSSSSSRTIIGRSGGDGGKDTQDTQDGDVEEEEGGPASAALPVPVSVPPDAVPVVVTPAHPQEEEFNAIPSPGVYDSYILHADTVGCSDHCPVVLVIKV